MVRWKSLGQVDLAIRNSDVPNASKQLLLKNLHASQNKRIQGDQPAAN